jgi:hypothetical protein
MVSFLQATQYDIICINDLNQSQSVLNPFQHQNSDS